MSPAKSKAQQRFMGAELRRKRAGQKTQTGMSAKQLKEFASTPRKGLPARKEKGVHMMSGKEMNKMMKPPPPKKKGGKK